MDSNGPGPQQPRWKRKQRHHYELEGKVYTASIYRDPSKKFWWFGIRGHPTDFRKAPVKIYAKAWAEQKMKGLGELS